MMRLLIGAARIDIHSNPLGLERLRRKAIKRANPKSRRSRPTRLQRAVSAGLGTAATCDGVDGFSPGNGTPRHPARLGRQVARSILC
jgi:hypothetical protein